MTDKEWLNSLGGEKLIVTLRMIKLYIHQGVKEEIALNEVRALMDEELPETPERKM